MGDSNVEVGSLEQPFLVLAPEDVAATAADQPGDFDRHLGYRTRPRGPIFLPGQPSPLAASA
jgi:hypothetical protein